MSDEYVKDEEILETRWTCSTCGRDNRGRDMQCQGCGAPKDESSGYRLDDSAEVVTDTEQLADAEAGEHWVCSYCEKQNRGRKLICRFCGADQTAKKPSGDAPPPLPQSAGKKPSALLGCTILLAGLFGVLALLYWLGTMDRVEGKVTAIAWEQRVHLHERTLAHGEKWQDEVPADAFDQACERRQRTTREVIDHYRTVTKTRSVKYQSGSREECREVKKDLGNGYASRKTVCKQVPEYDYRDETYTDEEPVYRTEPVYDRYCRYKVYEWPIVKTAKREGTGTGGYERPATSELGVRGCTPCSQKTAGLERCCSEEDVWRVTFARTKKSDDPKENAPLVYEAKSQAEYESFEPGATLTLEVDDGRVTVLRDE